MSMRSRNEPNGLFPLFSTHIGDHNNGAGAYGYPTCSNKCIRVREIDPSITHARTQGNECLYRLNRTSPSLRKCCRPTFADESDIRGVGTTSAANLPGLCLQELPKDVDVACIRPAARLSGRIAEESEPTSSPTSLQKFPTCSACSYRLLLSEHKSSCR